MYIQILKILPSLQRVGTDKLLPPLPVVRRQLARAAVTLYPSAPVRDRFFREIYSDKVKMRLFRVQEQS